MPDALFRGSLPQRAPRLRALAHPGLKQRQSNLLCRHFFVSSISPPRSLAISSSKFSLGRSPIGVVRAEANAEASARVSVRGTSGVFFLKAIRRNAEDYLQALQKLTPLSAVKWAAVAALALTLFRVGYTIFYAPAVWTYASWFFAIWPLPVAVAVGLWSMFAALSLQYNKEKTSFVKERDQIFILAGALTWLILVPLGLRHGYIETWPLTLFFVYQYFFLVPAIVRLRQYGELTPRTEDKQWSSSPSMLMRIAFGIAVVGSHWLAAFEGPHLYFTWNWQWPSCIAFFVLVIAYTLQSYGWHFLGKYSDQLMKPQQIVIFGPYRIVRHPIYTGYILLFAGYCFALRAYKSLIFLTIASLFYYDQRARIEEKKLEEAFGKEQYKVFRKKTKYKFFPFLY